MTEGKKRDALRACVRVLCMRANRLPRRSRGRLKASHVPLGTDAEHRETSPVCSWLGRLWVTHLSHLQAASDIVSHLRAAYAVLAYITQFCLRRIITSRCRRPWKINVPLRAEINRPAKYGPMIKIHCCLNVLATPAYAHKR